MTLGIVKKNEQEFADLLRKEWGFLKLAHLNGERINLQPYQLSFIFNPSRFRWITKSRQGGLFVHFCPGVPARCHLRNNHTSVIISYNQDDSKEKILIARQIHEGLPLAYQKRIKHDSKTELSFESNSAECLRINK